MFIIYFCSLLLCLAPHSKSQIINHFLKKESQLIPTQSSYFKKIGEFIFFYDKNDQIIEFSCLRYTQNPRNRIKKKPHYPVKPKNKVIILKEQKNFRILLLENIDIQYTLPHFILNVRQLTAPSRYQSTQMSQWLCVTGMDPYRNFIEKIIPIGNSLENYQSFDELEGPDGITCIIPINDSLLKLVSLHKTVKLCSINQFLTFSHFKDIPFPQNIHCIHLLEDEWIVLLSHKKTYVERLENIISFSFKDLSPLSIPILHIYPVSKGLIAFKNRVGQLYLQEIESFKTTPLLQVDSFFTEAHSKHPKWILLTLNDKKHHVIIPSKKYQSYLKRTQITPPPSALVSIQHLINDWIHLTHQGHLHRITTYSEWFLNPHFEPINVSQDIQDILHFRGPWIQIIELQSFFKKIIPITSFNPNCPFKNIPGPQDIFKINDLSDDWISIQNTFQKSKIIPIEEFQKQQKFDDLIDQKEVFLSIIIHDSIISEEISIEILKVLSPSIHPISFFLSLSQIEHENSSTFTDMLKKNQDLTLEKVLSSLRSLPISHLSLNDTVHLYKQTIMNQLKSLPLNSTTKVFIPNSLISPQTEFFKKLGEFIFFYDSKNKLFKFSALKNCYIPHQSKELPYQEVQEEHSILFLKSEKCFKVLSLYDTHIHYQLPPFILDVQHILLPKTKSSPLRSSKWIGVSGLNSLQQQVTKIIEIGDSLERHQHFDEIKGPDGIHNITLISPSLLKLTGLDQSTKICPIDIFFKTKDFQEIPFPDKISDIQLLNNNLISLLSKSRKQIKVISIQDISQLPPFKDIPSPENISQITPLSQNIILIQNLKGTVDIMPTNCFPLKKVYLTIRPYFHFKSASYLTENWILIQLQDNIHHLIVPTDNHLHHLKEISPQRQQTHFVSIQYLIGEWIHIKNQKNNHYITTAESWWTHPQIDNLIENQNIKSITHFEGLWIKITALEQHREKVILLYLFNQYPSFNSIPGPNDIISIQSLAEHWILIKNQFESKIIQIKDFENQSCFKDFIDQKDLYFQNLLLQSITHHENRLRLQEITSSNINKMALLFCMTQIESEHSIQIFERLTQKTPHSFDKIWEELSSIPTSKKSLEDIIELYKQTFINFSPKDKREEKKISFQSSLTTLSSTPLTKNTLHPPPYPRTFSSNLSPIKQPSKNNRLTSSHSDSEYLPHQYETLPKNFSTKKTNSSYNTVKQTVDSKNIPPLTKVQYNRWSHSISHTYFKKNLYC